MTSTHLVVNHSSKDFKHLCFHKVWHSFGQFPQATEPPEILLMVVSRSVVVAKWVSATRGGNQKKSLTPLKNSTLKTSEHMAIYKPQNQMYVCLSLMV